MASERVFLGIPGLELTSQTFALSPTHKLLDYLTTFLVMSTFFLNFPLICKERTVWCFLGSENVRRLRECRMKCLLSVYFYPRMILLKGFDLLPERAKEQSLDEHTGEQISQPPAIGERMVRSLVAAVIWRIRLPGTSPPPPPSRLQPPQLWVLRYCAGSRAGAQRPLRSVAVLWRLVHRCPRVIPPWPLFRLCLGLRVAAVPSPGPLQHLPRTIPARPLPSDPALHNAGAKSPRA